jgi:hypothetical protein
LSALTRREESLKVDAREQETQMENACAELRARTETALSKLKALEEVLKERQDTALAELRGEAGVGRNAMPTTQIQS